ncbi:hypothetical protein SAMN05444374_1189 [Rhodococcoides kroppenstedtii]|uniref:Uncharacterized protein n=2 Tax=Rhodococcoides kroppenstedtii TaxID=293050 RepID=A0A1I0UBU9_9NOCA|nr:hypothetical protein SAMN05444374_1189 [Rhodococcus kroppenstedtii]
MQPICELNENDYTRFHAAYNVMFNMLEANMFTYVRQSGLDLFRTVMDASEAFRDGKIPAFGEGDMVEWATRIRTGILGVCSSIHHHQEQSLIAVVRQFDKDSAEHVEMKRLFKAVYDRCFAYRLLFRLRHIMVHSTMLAPAMKATAGISEGEKYALVDMRLDRSVFYESSKISAAIKAELRALDEDPSIYELVGEVMPELRDTNREVLALLHPDIDDTCATVREFDALFGGQPGRRALVRQQSPELRPPFETSYQAWPPSVFDYAHARAVSNRVEAEG